MKKIIFILLVVMMLMGTAFAEEEFTLHNGTKFGMTFDEVRELEQETIDGPLNEKWGITVNNYDNDGYILSMKAVIAGYDNTGLVYGLINNKLVAMKYFFSNYSDTVFDEYNNIEQGLVKKYGEAEYSSLNGLSLPTVQIYPSTSFIQGCTEDSMIPEHSVRSLTRDMYSHRLIANEDGTSVLIDHSITSIPMDKGGRLYYHHLGYYFFTEQEVQIFHDAIGEFINDL